MSENEKPIGAYAVNDDESPPPYIYLRSFSLGLLNSEALFLSHELFIQDLRDSEPCLRDVEKEIANHAYDMFKFELNGNQCVQRYMRDLVMEKNRCLAKV